MKLEHWMGPATADWLIIAAYIVFSLAVGIYFTKRARKSTRDYFISGGGMPWWILGTSMVATTFAADTPLALSGWVVDKGISQNWFWWCQVPITMAGVFFFARLWKRANIITDMEYVHVRYSGKPADILRGFKAVYLALPYGCLVMGWVNKAMSKIISLTFPKLPHIPVIDGFLHGLYLKTPVSAGLPGKVRALIEAGKLNAYAVYDKLGLTGKARVLELAYQQKENIDSTALFTKLNLTEHISSLQATYAIDPLMLLSGVAQYVSGINELKILLFLFCVTIIYTTISGLWGVLITDFFQFFIAMFGCIYLAVVAVNVAGGMDQVFAQMKEIYTAQKAIGMVHITPIKASGGVGLMPIYFFWIFILMAWWSVGFTDGGSYFAQRMLSAKNERHASLGYLWYGVAHYTLRMWPWLVVGMVAAVMFPYIKDPVTGLMPTADIAEDGYIKVMITVLGPGMLGLVLVAFFAAYMSTISTQVNLGASYLVNDFYQPYIAKGRSEKHYVGISMIATLFMAFAGIVVSLYINTIAGAWFLLAALNSGIGIVYLLRWYWWRINAWTEMVCIGMLLYLALAFYVLDKHFEFGGVPYPLNLLITVPVAVGIALAITALTAPVDKEKLISFYKRVQPGGPGWKPIQELVPDLKPKTPLNLTNLKGFLLSVVTIYCFLFGFGKVIIGNALYPEPVIGNITFSVIFLIVAAYLIGKAISMASKPQEFNAAKVLVRYVIALFLLIVSLVKLIANPNFIINLSLYNRTFGILLILLGLYLGYLVAMTFSVKKWTE